jgi:hypothetical protein
VRNLLPEVHAVILQLEQVSFVDSSGLGAMVRLVSSARASGTEIKLCAIPSILRKTLEVTNLLSLFDIHESEADAITAAYLGSRYANDRSAQAQPRILCVHDSSDVLAYVSELLCRSGYRALSSSNVHDARILLKAARAPGSLFSVPIFCSSTGVRRNRLFGRSILAFPCWCWKQISRNKMQARRRKNC